MFTPWPPQVYSSSLVGVGWSLMVIQPCLTQYSAVSVGTSVSVPLRCSPSWYTRCGSTTVTVTVSVLGLGARPLRVVIVMA